MKKDKREKKVSREIHDTRNGKESLFEEALFAVEAQDPNIRWYTKAAAVKQNAIQSYPYDEEKGATTQTSHHCFQEGRYS